jgi:hypothetical protein
MIMSQLSQNKADDPASVHGVNYDRARRQVVTPIWTWIYLGLYFFAIPLNICVNVALYYWWTNGVALGAAGITVIFDIVGSLVCLTAAGTAEIIRLCCRIKSVLGPIYLVVVIVEIALWLLIATK